MIWTLQKLQFLFHTVYISSRRLLTACRSFVKGPWFVRWNRTRVLHADKTSETIFMEITVSFVYEAWLFFWTTAIIIAVIVIPGTWIASWISLYFAIDSRSFIIRSIFYLDNGICYKARAGKMFNPDKYSYVKFNITFSMVFLLICTYRYRILFYFIVAGIWSISFSRIFSA